MKNIHNEVTLLIIEIKIPTSWSPAGDYERCRGFLLKKFKNNNNYVTLLIIEMKILTGSMTVSCLVCSPDEQNPSSTPPSLEQMNPSQQSESETQTNPLKENHKEVRCWKSDVKVALTHSWPTGHKQPTWPVLISFLAFTRDTSLVFFCSHKSLLTSI